MGKQFRKVVVAADKTYMSPLGRVDVPANRIQKWIKNFNAQKAKGIKIPVPWGHQPKANPVNAGNVEEEEFLKSKFNATYLDGLETTAAGELVMVADIPPGLELDDKGNLLDPKSHTMIAEVSLSARDWTDGDGVLWKDAIRHIALTPLPVAHGTQGFEPARLAVTEAGEVRLSLSMATEDFPPKKKDDDAGAGDGKPPDAEGKKDDDEKKKKDGEGDKNNEPPPDETKSGDFTVERASELLKEFDIVVSQASTPEQFVQYLCIALDALVGQLADQEDQQYQEEPVPAMMSLAARTTYALASRLRRLRKITERRKKMAEQKPPENKPAGPVVLSLGDHADPVVKALSQRVVKDDMAKREARIAALEKRGLPPADAKALREEAATVQLSLSNGEVVEPPIDREIKAWEKALPAKDPLTTRMSLHEVTPPEGDLDADKEMREEAKKRAEKLSVKPRTRRQAS